VFALWLMLLSHLSRFDFVCYLISWVGHNGDGLSQKKTFNMMNILQMHFAFIIEIFYRLHQQANDFFHHCANMI